LISTDVDDYPEALKKYRKDLAGRSMLVLKTRPLPVECVVRGYLSGSGWKEYKQKQSICSIQLPPGLKESDSLGEPIFTPSTKADVGHDENVSQEYIEALIGAETANRLKEISIAVYKRARDYALGKGIIIADTKSNSACMYGKLVIIDEVLPRILRGFWPLEVTGLALPSPVSTNSL
jgi:phosphoribosylaminoimidazole-succinocarboxamide synthase